MEPEDIVMCNTDGFLLAARAGLTQCSEVKIHACIYKLRADVNAYMSIRAIQF